MKKMVLGAILAVIAILPVAGCADFSATTKTLFPYGGLSPEQDIARPGDVLFIYGKGDTQNAAGASVMALVFPGAMNENDLFAVDPQTGLLTLSRPPIDKFIIESPFMSGLVGTAYRRRRQPQRPNADYTYLFVYYRPWLDPNRGYLAYRICIIRTQIPINQYDADSFGNRRYASLVFYVPTVNTQSGPVNQVIYIPLGEFIQDAWRDGVRRRKW
jgi:hypothetical protein